MKLWLLSIFRILPWDKKSGIRINNRLSVDIYFIPRESSEFLFSPGLLQLGRKFLGDSKPVGREEGTGDSKNARSTLTDSRWVFHFSVASSLVLPFCFCEFSKIWADRISQRPFSIFQFLLGLIINSLFLTRSNKYLSFYVSQDL